MYRQNINVAFHQMDRSANELATTIVDLAHDIDPNNLVILCGETHNQKAHQFYQTRLMYHLNETGMLATFCQELDHSLHKKIGRAEKASSIVKKIDYPFNACSLLAHARTWDIPANMIDMAHRKNTPQRDNLCKFPQHMIGSPLVRHLRHTKQITPYFHKSKKPLYNISARGQTQRDVFMMEQIHDITARKLYEGFILTSNGYDHVYNESIKGRPNLTTMLLATGMDVITIGISSDKPKKPRAVEGLSRAQKKRHHAAIHINLADSKCEEDDYFSLKASRKAWTEMERANHVPSLCRLRP